MRSSLATFGQRKRRRPKHAGRVYVEKHGYGKNWSQQRAKTLERDDYTCQKCFVTGRLKTARDGRKYWSVHVHHKRKISHFYDRRTDTLDYSAANDLSNLITLCANCHPYADGHKERQGFIRIK